MYQYVNNQGGQTDINEVEAKLFSAKMNHEIDGWNIVGSLQYISSFEDTPYNSDIQSLLYDGYNQKLFDKVVNSFFTGPGKNYKNISGYEVGNISSEPLIKSFLPIKEPQKEKQ